MYLLRVLPFIRTGSISSLEIITLIHSYVNIQYGLIKYFIQEKFSPKSSDELKDKIVI